MKCPRCGIGDVIPDVRRVDFDGPYDGRFYRVCLHCDFVFTNHEVMCNKSGQLVFVDEEKIAAVY